MVTVDVLSTYGVALLFCAWGRWSNCHSRLGLADKYETRTITTYGSAVLCDRMTVSF